MPGKQGSYEHGIEAVGAEAMVTVPGPEASIDEAVITARACTRPSPRSCWHPAGGDHRRGGGDVGQPPPHRGRARRGQDRPGPGPGAALGVQLSRVQGHPDLLPSDVTGVTVFSRTPRPGTSGPGPVSGTWSSSTSSTGPRRAPSRRSSEAMEEQQVSVDGESWPLPRPHLVIGPRNPVGQLGTYPLVESQLDRFGLSTTIGYPDAEVETRLVLHSGGRYALDTLTPVSDPTRWERAIAATATVHVVTAVAEYAVSLVRATRTAGTVRLGASPRAAISLIRSAQATPC